MSTEGQAVINGCRCCASVFSCYLLRLQRSALCVALCNVLATL